MKHATWLFADPHFGHESIIRMCGRPFANVAEMNQTMADAWRKVVKPGDDIIVVGDFAHRMPVDQLRKLFDSLPGNKHIVLGNHDGEETRELPWASQRDIAFVSIDGTRCVLCHYALRTWPCIRKGALMLYGHSHGRLPGNSQSMDIGVDVFGWAPLRLNQIKAHLATLPPLVDPEAGDDFENNESVKP
ncbi:metallophosphoesterase [Bradyrhizobium betae]|uniref:metallophosphoesterase n=1 Tax=Bradyrhizobium betae TaxID=244734 RepID=UPI0013873420|nr:metallophosphoesterase [Bradyrhizobium betae]MCS3727286.1 calcineurin-like phosphoesterase family protein [Bradyrhizobium betae]